jgi:hypothetical protein
MLNHIVDLYNLIDFYIFWIVLLPCLCTGKSNWYFWIFNLYKMADWLQSIKEWLRIMLMIQTFGGTESIKNVFVVAIRIWLDMLKLNSVKVQMVIKYGVRISAGGYGCIHCYFPIFIWTFNRKRNHTFAVKFFHTETVDIRTMLWRMSLWSVCLWAG